MLGLLASGDSANGARSRRGGVCLQWTETDLYRKFVPILMQAVQFQARPHRSHPRFNEKTRAVARMPPPEPFRHQHLNLMIKQVLTLVAEQFLDLRIDQNNLPLSIHHHHRIGGGFQQSTEPDLTSFSLRDVSYDARNRYALLG